MFISVERKYRKAHFVFKLLCRIQIECPFDDDESQIQAVLTFDPLNFSISSILLAPRNTSSGHMIMTDADKAPTSVASQLRRTRVLAKRLDAKQKLAL